MTVLLPDLRGHGRGSAGHGLLLRLAGGEDALAALEYLRGLKSPQGRALVGRAVGRLRRRGRVPTRRSRRRNATRPCGRSRSTPCPIARTTVLAGAVRDRTGLDNRLLQAFARLGTRVYFAGRYKADRPASWPRARRPAGASALGRGCRALKPDDRDARQLLPHPRQRRDAHRPSAHRPRPRLRLSRAGRSLRPPPHRLLRPGASLKKWAEADGSRQLRRRASVRAIGGGECHDPPPPILSAPFLVLTAYCLCLLTVSHTRARTTI